MGHIKATAIDLDGTLIGADERVSPLVADAVRRLAERVPVSIVTGRELESVISFAGELGLTSPQVADNGALIIDPVSGIELWSAPMDEKSARLALQLIIESDCHFMATHANGVITDVDKIGGWALTRVTAFDLTEVDADGMIQRMSRVGSLDAVKAYLPYNGLWAVNLNRRGINKGAGLRALCRLLGIEPSDVAAIGDSYNDIPMFQLAGLSIAMGGAAAELREAADYVVANVEQDGLAEAIDRHMLPLLVDMD